MSGPLSWRLVRHGPTEGAVNMAVDHALATTLEPGHAVLRLYEWEPPTVSFGRNQPAAGAYEERALADAGYGVVRRPTGGRAVLHDRELTYSVVVHAAALGGPRAAYRTIHEALCDALTGLGVPAELTPAGGSVTRPDTNPCFADPAPGEIQVAGRKLVGSAQARIGRVILQHGSVLTVNDQSVLRTLSGAPADSGPSTVPVGLTLAALGLAIDPPTVGSAVESSFRRRFDFESGEGRMSEREGEEARALEVRYRSEEWTWRR